MKHFIYLLMVFVACVMMFNSCEKIATPEKISTVSFSVSLLGEGKPITRAAFDTDAISSLLQNCMPTYYDLILVNTTNGNKYYCKTNEAMAIPNGTYTVKTPTEQKFFDTKAKNWFTKDIGLCCDNAKYNYFVSVGQSPMVSCGPKISVNETITIEQNGNISLNGIFNSSAIVFDANKVQRLEGCASYDYYTITCAIIENGVGVFFTNKCTYDGFKLAIYPFSNVDAEKTEIEFSFNELKNGMYYIVQPNMVQRSDFNGIVSVKNWEEGGNLT